MMTIKKRVEILKTSTLADDIIAIEDATRLAQNRVPVPAGHGEFLSSRSGLNSGTPPMASVASKSISIASA
jgi:hypothetical protein